MHRCRSRFLKTNALSLYDQGHSQCKNPCPGSHENTGFLHHCNWPQYIYCNLFFLSKITGCLLQYVYFNDSQLAMYITFTLIIYKTDLIERVIEINQIPSDDPPPYIYRAKDSTSFSFVLHLYITFCNSRPIS